MLFGKNVIHPRYLKSILVSLLNRRNFIFKFFRIDSNFLVNLKSDFSYFVHNRVFHFILQSFLPVLRYRDQSILPQYKFLY